MKIIAGREKEALGRKSSGTKIKGR